MKILIAEDDAVSQRLLRSYLEKWGHEVSVARDGAEALALFERGEFAVVVSDWMMPELDGVELIRRIRARGGENYVYCILLTSRAQKEDLVEGIDAGADDLLTKPFDRDELRVRLRAGERILALQRDLAQQNRALRETQREGGEAPAARRATRTREELLRWASAYVALWNAGDKAAWAANWRAVAPGEFRMLDPVGTPEKRGFEACALKPWDLFQPHVRFRVIPGSQHVCGNEVAWLLENSFASEPSRPPHLSIETYRFEDNGDVVIRTYYEVPAQRDGALGELFKTYLPTGG